MVHRFLLFAQYCNWYSGSLFIWIFFGGFAGKAILIKKKDYTWEGFKYGMLSLIFATFLASWVGFFQEGIDNIGTGDDPFFDYIFKPLFWVFFFGLVPTLLIGFLFGKRIKKKGRKYLNGDKVIEKSV